jgi:hypothetical protein
LGNKGRQRCGKPVRGRLLTHNLHFYSFALSFRKKKNCASNEVKKKKEWSD